MWRIGRWGRLRHILIVHILRGTPWSGLVVHHNISNEVSVFIREHLTGKGGLDACPEVAAFWLYRTPHIDVSARLLACGHELTKGCCAPGIVP